MLNFRIFFLSFLSPFSLVFSLPLRFLFLTC